jgi:hypothetical protein
MTRPEKRPQDAVNPQFADPLPDIGFDERDSNSPDDEAEHERWLRDNIPPHHG